MSQARAISYIFSGNEDRLIQEMKAGLVHFEDSLLSLCLEHDLFRAIEYMALKNKPSKSTFAVMVAKDELDDEVIGTILIRNPTWNDQSNLMTASYSQGLRRFKKMCALNNYTVAAGEEFLKMLLDAKHLEPLRLIEEQDSDLFWLGISKIFQNAGLLTSKSENILYRKGAVRVLKEFANTETLQEKTLLFCGFNAALTEIFEEA